MISSQHPSEQYQNISKVSPFAFEKINESSLYTKTTTRESKENEKEFNQTKGNVDSLIVYNNVLNGKNLEI